MDCQQTVAPSSSVSGSPHSLPDAFPGGELLNALKEHSFGISHYGILRTSPHEAKARVVLLEENVVTVLLTTDGYSIADGDECRGGTFESLEDLLAAVSPRFVESRQQSLIAKLQLLAESEDRQKEI
ncbi:hypothetical protein DAEQUDRAFT_741715 [Daedalea quercina L-15889]|uniref:GSKIP domain-containing protein n=1 Tax=Daedalea quercina L-15889 TaxID=1314783 RepID=A0A165KZ44_9APHY|nr:hypothetical protein DAEQUDRAFT_741715 [Daedalea quercina L-15889]